MAEFYHGLITEKSWKTLQKLRKEFSFILIGGWAVYLYTKVLKSKDVDIVIDYDQLERFKKEFSIFKNERLKKYEAKIEEIDIDIYLPFFSDLGFPIEEIKNYVRALEGFKVPVPEILLILKIKPYFERKGTTKGQKDLIDIFSLLKEEKIDWQKYRELVKKYNLGKIDKELRILISGAKAIPELGLLNHKIAKLKKKILKFYAD
jgi:DNA-binding transcriptional MerR regulator